MNIIIIGAEGTGKTTLADAIQKLSGNLFTRRAFADIPRQLIAEDLNWPEFVELSKDQATKNSPHCWLGYETPRQWLIEYSETEKEKDPLIWTRTMCQLIQEDQRPFIIEDARFWHEIAPATMRPTVLLWLTRPGEEPGDEKEYQLPALAEIVDSFADRYLRLTGRPAPVFTVESKSRPPEHMAIMMMWRAMELAAAPSTGFDYMDCAERAMMAIEPILRGDFSAATDMTNYGSPRG